MKKTLSLILALVMCLSLCACGGEKLTSDKMAQLTIEAGLDALKKDGISEVFCENFRFYEAGDYSYIQTPLWYLTEEGVRYSQMVAQFNDAEMTNFAIDVMNNPFPDKSKGEENPEDAPEYAELFALCGGSATTMEATSELCNPVNVITFDEMIVRFGTQIAQEYTMGLMDTLVNPYSIKIHNVWCYSNGSKYYLTITFSAGNKAGGTETFTYGNSIMDPLYPHNYKENLKESGFGAFSYFEKNQTYAKDMTKDMTLDANAIQEYVLKNY